MQTWYSTADLTIPRVPVIWRLASGETLHGVARFTPSGKLMARIKSPSGWVELSGRKTPPYWTPLVPAKWPGRLPDAVSVEGGADGIGAIDLDDDAATAAVRLGSAGEPPRSIREAEIRVLRCIRTARVMEYEPVKVDTAWPRALMDDIKAVEHVLKASKTGEYGRFRAEDYDDYHVDKSDLRALPARWKPTPRDVSDYERKPAPTAFMHPHDKSLFRWRAALPAFSFTQIAEQMRCDEVDAIEMYRVACQRMMDAWIADKPFTEYSDVLT